MKDHEESESDSVSEESEDLVKEEAAGLAFAPVESDTKHPGERHDTYVTTIKRRGEVGGARYANTHSHTHTPDLRLSQTSMFMFVPSHTSCVTS